MSITAPAIAHPAFAPGTVWLAGAGPGDPSLLTLAALHALQTADVILHDALVAPEILALAPVTTRLIPTGKRAGGAQTPQLAINAELIALAQQNLRVLRLKGGDPFIFGRGGEECLALAAASISYRVIPGISAGIGATTAAMLPITHRGLARSVLFATGETGPTGPQVDFASLAHAADTLVLYMARNTIGSIAASLIAAGRNPADPVAFLLDATTPRQKIIHTTLAEAGPRAADLGTEATLIIIGPVVSLSALLTPAAQLPIPVTRAQEA
ncbi:MAG TPA: uroporphyrinogen-III C-methyltransferase [Acidiphilium sp.]|nr:MAG: uroporphyrinogen-III C-methyltransferase [Acidiphilium sp. 21-60-14]OYV89657.1 MAG: uroporphyrinogen-III C-methyltransferase [Acidiphilium sp. 37-60-79]HQT88555.1 uroporphyrinogen-III C-methyltransferase [Acidiphilium sp.]HQU24376.1 uroporphyrinogen-III C-methyltransferase [Acidiphilium sp.]